ncbi:MAG: radical SAM protein, partial [Fuerstiella sp.]
AGAWQETDFSPLPCAHPNAHTLAYGVREGDRVLPLARFVDLENHLDLLSGRITFNRQRAQELIAEYLSRQPCGAGSCPTDESLSHDRQGFSADCLSQQDLAVAQQFFAKAMTQQLNPSDMFRITTTSFMDAWNFDVRQLMKSCVHFVLPSGHLVPFSAYNVLYRDGHAPLPPLITPNLVTC